MGHSVKMGHSKFSTVFKKSFSVGETDGKLVNLFLF